MLTSLAGFILEIGGDYEFLDWVHSWKRVDNHCGGSVVIDSHARAYAQELSLRMWRWLDQVKRNGGAWFGQPSKSMGYDRAGASEAEQARWDRLDAEIEADIARKVSNLSGVPIDQLGVRCGVCDEYLSWCGGHVETEYDYEPVPCDGCQGYLGDHIQGCQLAP